MGKSCICKYWSWRAFMLFLANCSKKHCSWTYMLTNMKNWIGKDSTLSQMSNFLQQTLHENSELLTTCLTFSKNSWKTGFRHFSYKQDLLFKQVSVILLKILNRKNRKQEKNSFKNLLCYPRVTQMKWRNLYQCVGKVGFRKQITKLCTCASST